MKFKKYKPKDKLTKKLISLRLDQELLASLSKIAKKEGVTFTSLVSEMLNHCILTYER